MREAVTRLGLRGLKVHCYDAPPKREICEAVRAFGIPMLVDVVGRAYLVELFAPQYPDVNFIIPHFGSFVDDWRAQQQVVDQLVRFPNVYADTAGVRRFDFIVQGIRRAGAAQGAVRIGRPLAAPSGRAPQDSHAGPFQPGRGTRPGRQRLVPCKPAASLSTSFVESEHAPQFSTAHDGAFPKR